MSYRVKHDEHTTALIQRIKRLAKTQRERAAILGITPRYQRMIEHGHVQLRLILSLLDAGVLVVPPDTELAHETNDDTKGADA